MQKTTPDKRCCVFQPFDGGGPFDKRYDDVLEPSIEQVELKAYRVDRDPKASIPIETLHREIEISTACLADISTDNPNVWYELGYAMAMRKPTVMICSDDRKGKYPFDIHHRQIITYKLESPRDFEKLKQDIANRLVAELEKTGRVEQIIERSPMPDTEGLRAHEIAALSLIMASRDSSSSGVSAWIIKSEMKAARYNDLATSLALALLQQKNFVNTADEQNYNGETYTGYYLTDLGENWLLKNQDTLELRSPARKRKDEEDIPF